MSNPQKAQQELARRELASQSLTDFCAYVDPGAAYTGAKDTFVKNRYRAPHLVKIASIIQQAMDGSLWANVPGHGMRVLLFTTPPGHWKSSLVSRKFPAFYIGHNQRAGLPHQVILTSYNATLAEANNRAVLELVRDNPLYHNVFPDIHVSRSSQSSEIWSLEGEPFPACVAGGVGGGLTGQHGVVVVDDPIRDRAQANSLTYIQTLRDWWRDVVRTRPRRGEFILGIWTRWTELDPAGELLREKREGRNDDQVIYVRLSALAETTKERESAASMGLPVEAIDPLGRQPGEALWPDEVSADEHEATRKAYPVTFDSLYQGRPRPQGGFVVGRAQFKTLPAAPTKDIKWVLGIDWAYTEKQVAPKQNDPDYTAVVLVGLWTPANNKEDARLVIGYAARKQCNQHEARQFAKFQLLSLGKHIPTRSAQDGIDKLFLDALRRDADLIGYSIKNLGNIPGDKVTKATPWLEMAHAGNVYLVSGPWNDDYLESVERFPHGAHDDYEDATSVGVHSHGLGQKERKASSSSGVKFYGR